MNNFFLCSIFVRSASVSHRLALYFSHDLQPTSERSELPTTSADERPTTSGAPPPSSGMTHSRFRASCLPYQCVINRAVSTAYPICTPLPPFFRQIRCTDPSRWQKIKQYTATVCPVRCTLYAAPYGPYPPPTTPHPAILVTTHALRTTTAAPIVPFPLRPGRRTTTRRPRPPLRRPHELRRLHLAALPRHRTRIHLRPCHRLCCRSQ